MTGGEAAELVWMLGEATGATEAGVICAGGSVDFGEEEGDKFGWSAMKRRAAVACLSTRGERRGRIRAREASMLYRVVLEGCRGRRRSECVSVRVGNKISTKPIP
jgi:hypothetical protein